MAASFAFDIISVLDALYAVDQATDTWVAGVLEVAERFWAKGAASALHATTSQVRVHCAP